MISVTKLRNSVTFFYRNQPHKVIKYTHTHLSRGAGTIKIKARNLQTGKIANLSFKSGDKVEDVEVTTRKLQYLYADIDEHYFMDPVSFSQISISNKVVAKMGKFLKEGKDYLVKFYDNPKDGAEEPLEVEIPTKISLRIKEAAPGVKGDTQGSATKDAVLENGLKVRVPLFIKKGDRVRVDTRTGEYVERGE